MRHAGTGGAWHTGPVKARFEQLAGLLEKPLAPIYLLSGDEPLQLGEAADAVRAAARAQGYSERQVMHVETGFDWSSLLAEAGSLSLFAERRLLDLRLPSAKPGDAGARALTGYAGQPPEDTLLLITCGKLDSSQQRSKWFTALERAGVVVQVWPVEPARLPEWVARRMRAHELSPSPAAAALLADHVEGNLLAAAQEIEKLRLLNGPGEIDAEAVAAAVADSARFDVFALADAALAGDAVRSARVLYGLRAEGVEPVLVLWALARELRSLAALAFAARGGEGLEAAMGRLRVWPRRKPLITQALRRHSAARWRALLARSARIDRLIKGMEPGNAWDELLQLSEMIAGQPLLLPAARRRQAAAPL